MLGFVSFLFGFMWLSFFAAAVSDSGSTVFRWARVQENQDYFIPIVIALLLAIFFIRRYRIDAIDLRGWQRFLLLSLRVVVIVMLLLVYFHPQWERFIASSRVAIMIDSSASMGNRDLSPHRSNETKLLTSDNNDNNNDLVESGDLSIELSRLEAVVDWVKRSELVERLSEQHDVILYSFDKTVRRINQNQTTQSSSLELSETNENNTAQSSTSLPNSDSSTSADRVVGEFDLVRSQLEALDLIKADGEETNIGDALFDVLQLERGRPLAGVVIISDGRQNSGRAVESSLEVASRLRIPFYSVGVGASRQPLNFRVVSFDSPERFFPDDSFSIKVPIELIGGDVGDQNDQDNQGELKSHKVKVELWSQQVEGDSNSETKLDEKEIQFDRNGVIVAEFQAKFTTVGKRRLMVKILPPPEDSVLDDDVRYADIEIVDRKDRVLMYASAPSRDYQFICSQVFRDKTMSVDVYLPWAQKGIAQNADKILTTFPMTQSEMSEYDIVFAFDPDWVDLSAEQINVLEDWVARRGGGLVLFAGAVNLANPAGWISHSGLEKIWALYPVEFLVRQPSRAFEHHYRSGVKAWPLKFSRFGEEAEFLRPLDNQAEARNFWETFPGFYGFFPVKSVKPTATLLASTSAPDAIGEMGALFVEQYYGSGRVLYFGSSELWRLRRLGENFYEQIITRMIRHASQGRLQRDSDRGSVSLDKRHYGLGSVAKLRVTANDDQLNPITLSKLPIDVLSPAGKLRTLEVMLDPNAAGIYQGYVPLTEEGTWTVKLNIPSSQQEITRTFQVQMSDLERENPSRNEQLLSEIALRSGGIYFRLPTDAMPLVKESVLYGQKNPFVLPNTESNNPENQNQNQNDNTETNIAETKNPNQYLTELIKVRSQRAVLDATAEENMLRTFLIIICSLLLLEWTLRRLMKLA